jgi:hypothetical protein
LDDDDSTDMAEMLKLHFVEHVLGPLQACLSDEISIINLNTRRVWASPNQGKDWVQTSTPGTVASKSLPIADCAVISFYAAGAGPEYRGRMYVAGVPQSKTAGGDIDDGYITILETFAAAHKTPAAASGHTTPWSGTLFSRVHDVPHSIAVYKARHSIKRIKGREIRI